MRWTWPSWLAILLGVIAVAMGFAWHDSSEYGMTSVALLVGGCFLLGSGLHALQSAWSACCDWYDGCDCDHCAGCKGDDCCGKCGCYDEPGRPGESKGHEGHGHDGGHSH